MAVQNIQAQALANLNISGMIVSNNATTPNTKLDVSAGICRDSNNVMDITFGASNTNYQDQYVTAPITIDCTLNGANGLDTGSLAAATFYAVYAIGDSSFHKNDAAIVTLASNSAPLMPAGYDSYRLIGYARTDGSSHFLLFFMAGNNNACYWAYDAPIATAVTAGAQTSYTGVVLTTFVPPVNNTPVYVQTNFTANAAADTLKLQGYSQVGDSDIIIAAVAGATAHVQTVSLVLAQLNSAAPTINYKVSSGSAAVAINVKAFQFFR